MTEETPNADETRITLTIGPPPDPRLRHPFEGPYLKIERAKRHVADCNAAINEWARNVNIQGVPERNPETGEMLSNLTMPESPPEIRLAAADAIYNMRSALDQAVSRCAILAGKSPKNTYFPRGKDLAGFEASLDAKCEEVPQPVRDVLTDLQPYYGGEGFLLQALHDLNLTDKHTDLIAHNMLVKEMTVASEKRPGPSPWADPKDTLVGDAAEFHTHHDIKLAITVAFAGVEPIKHQSVSEVLVQLLDVTTRVVQIIDRTMLKHLQDTYGAS